jgi:tetratricopeptide (TPR) repeat protein
LYGPLANRYYGTTNAAIFQPTNGVLLVARLDGPSAEIARSLVDKAMQAETNGLWGRAYFDARGLTNGEYKMGDDWIRGAAQSARRVGFETILDDQPGTFSAGFPLSQIGLYFGWYDGGVSGPFTLPQVEFMPGAIAYHLHSYSAHTIRSPVSYWVGPLLAKGATATMGSVDEPYLAGTPDLAVFLDRLVHGFTFGEAAYAAASTLSWQTTVVGDPLYRPFGQKPQALHEELTWRKSLLIEWSHLRIVNLNRNTGMPIPDLISYLEGVPETRTSAVLQEKLADLYHSAGKLGDAIEQYPKVLDLNPTRQQRIRVILNWSALLARYGKEPQALEQYNRFVKEFPDYPDLLDLYRTMLPLAQQLGKTGDAEQLQADINRLAPPPPPPAAPAAPAAPKS